MAKNPVGRPIDSLDALHRVLPELVHLQDTHPRLALAALANPLLAIEHAGYRLSPAIAREATLRTRFSPAEAERLLALEGELRQELGAGTDLDDPASFAAPLLQKVTGKPAKGTARTAARAVKAKPTEPDYPDLAPLRAALEQPLEPVRIGRAPPDDPLTAFADRHPLVASLVAYRALERTRPRLADRALFEGLLAGKVDAPLKAARFRYKPAPQRAPRKGR